MRGRQKILAGVILMVFFGLYAGTFSYWWLRSPSRVTEWQGKEIRLVEFQYNPVLWHTEPLWLPAFWFMERVCGYQPAGFAAAEGDSIRQYGKLLN